MPDTKGHLEYYAEYEIALQVEDGLKRMDLYLTNHALFAQWLATQAGNGKTGKSSSKPSTSTKEKT